MSTLKAMHFLLTKMSSDTRTLFFAKASKLIGALKTFVAISSTSDMLKDSRPLPMSMKAF